MIKIGCPSFGTDCGRSGIGSYLRELLDRFDSDDVSKEFSFELIGSKEDSDYYLKGKKNILWHQVEGVDNSPLQNFFWNQFSLPKICKKEGMIFYSCLQPIEESVEMLHALPLGLCTILLLYI